MTVMKNRTQNTALVFVLMLFVFSGCENQLQGSTDVSYRVFYKGNGQTSGSPPVDSTSYQPGSVVTISSNSGNLVKGTSAFTTWNTSIDGKGTSYSPGQAVTLKANPVLYASWLSSTPSLYYVNASSGSDSNTGTAAGSAFKTITKAISVAKSGNTVFVAPGTYNSALGETFPITIPAGVSLVGDESGKGSTTIITGSGPAGYSSDTCAVVPSTGSTLGGFTVTCTTQMGILLQATAGADNIVIRNNSITGNVAIGIYVTAGTGGSITGNLFTSNGSADLTYVASGGSSSVSGNTFNDLVELDVSGADFGGGATGSSGQNTFATANKTYFGCGGTVYAQNNHWPDTPPTVGSTFLSYDIAQIGATVVDYTGYY